MTFHISTGAAILLAISGIILAAAHDSLAWAAAAGAIIATIAAINTYPGPPPQ